jgi:hypothetical protein
MIISNQVDNIWTGSRILAKIDFIKNNKKIKNIFIEFENESEIIKPFIELKLVNKGKTIQEDIKYYPINGCINNKYIYKLENLNFIDYQEGKLFIEIYKCLDNNKTELKNFIITHEY